MVTLSKIIEGLEMVDDIVDYFATVEISFFIIFDISVLVNSFSSPS